MKTTGKVLLIIGIIATILFGIQVANDSETFNFLGIDIAVSKANWTPLIVSGIVLVIGFILTVSGRK